MTRKGERESPAGVEGACGFKYGVGDEGFWAERGHGGGGRFCLRSGILDRLAGLAVFRCRK